MSRHKRLDSHIAASAFSTVLGPSMGLEPGDRLVRRGLLARNVKGQKAVYQIYWSPEHGPYNVDVLYQQEGGFGGDHWVYSNANSMRLGSEAEAKKYVSRLGSELRGYVRRFR